MALLHLEQQIMLVELFISLPWLLVGFFHIINGLSVPIQEAVIKS